VADKRYFLLTTEWNHGFIHHNPIADHGLKSMVNFSRSLDYVKQVTYKEISAKQYQELMYGDDDGRDHKRETQQENPPKASRTKTKSKDSKGTRATRSQPSKLLKPTVRNVSKSKKDVQGTNDSGTKKLSKPRRTKGSSQ
jgi:hypothetical protein